MTQTRAESNTDVKVEIEGAYKQLESAERSQKAEFLKKSSGVARKSLMVLYAVLSIALFAELLARILVCTGQPVLFATPLFDRKKLLTESMPTDSPTVCFLGSSMSYRGVYSDYLNLNLKHAGFNKTKAYTLALNGALPLEELFLLNNALDHGVKPSLVVFEVNPLAFGMQDQLHTDFSETMKKARNFFILDRVKHILLSQPAPPFDLSVATHRFFEEYSYLYRFRDYFRTQYGSLVEMVFNTENQLKSTFRGKGVETEFSSCGYGPGYHFAELARNPQLSLKTRRAMLAKLFPSKEFDISKYESIKLVTAYCSKRNIPTALLWLPQNPVYSRVWHQDMGVTDEMLQTAMQKLAADNHIKLIDLHESVTDLVYFMDENHLNEMGSVEVTKQLSSILTSPPLSEVLRAREPVQ